jgi:hypothetical protein
MVTSAALRDLLLTRVFTFRTAGIADLCVFGEPLVHRAVVRKIGLLGGNHFRRAVHNHVSRFRPFKARASRQSSARC